MEGRLGAQCVLFFFPSKVLIRLQYVLAGVYLCFNFSIPHPRTHTHTLTYPSQYKGQAGYSIVCHVNPLCGKFCLCSEIFYAGFFPLAAVLYKLESP